jgi:hypothetical protein
VLLFSTLNAEWEFNFASASALSVQGSDLLAAEEVVIEVDGGTGVKRVSDK